MSIRVRVTLTLVAIGVALIGAYAWVAYRSEIEDLRTSSRRELAIVGRALETSLANALRDRQRADVVTTLATLQAIAPTVEIHIYEPDGRLLARSQGAHDDAVLARVVAGAIDTRKEGMQFDPDDDPTRLILAAPLVGPDGELLGGLVIVSSTDELDADLRRTRARLYVIVAVFLLVVTVAGILLGTVYVTRPIRRVLAAVRGVREGDFRRTVAPARHDEIGELVEEFNAMLRALAEARDRIAEETDAREHLERGLQRVDKMVTIGQLSAGLAHEIGSPLQVMAGRAAMLAESGDAEVRRQAKLLVEQCARITKIVEALLSFGRRAPAAFAPCDLAVPAKRVLELLEGEARRRQVALTFEGWSGAPVLVSADGDQMQQVVLNLVTNAMNATPPGGTIVVSLAAVAGGVELRVRDTGKGIPSESQTRLFEPFFTTRGTEGGSGLGLAVVRSIMVEHKGVVEVVSEVGEGAEMICRFPKEAA